MKVLRNTAVRLMMVALIVFFVIFAVALHLRNTELDRQIDTLQAKIDEQTSKIDELQADLDHPFDREYVERVAHENGYRYPQEIIFYSGDGN